MKTSSLLKYFGYIQLNKTYSSHLLYFTFQCATRKFKTTYVACIISLLDSAAVNGQKYPRVWSCSSPSLAITVNSTIIYVTAHIRGTETQTAVLLDNGSVHRAEFPELLSSTQVGTQQDWSSSSGFQAAWYLSPALACFEELNSAHSSF